MQNSPTSSQPYSALSSDFNTLSAGICLENLSAISKGFLLSSHARDSQDHTEVVLWVITDHQPARLVLEEETVVFFIADPDLQRASACLQQHDIAFHHKNTALKTFAQRPVSALYFPTISHARQAAGHLRITGITTYEK